MALSMQSDQSLVDTWLNILTVLLRLLLALLSIYLLLSLFFFGDQTLPNQQRILSSLDFGDLLIRSGIFISLVNEFIITLIVNVFKSWHFILGFLFKAIYGFVFPAEEEAAFSNYRLWQSFGFAISFAYSTYLYTSVKLYILAVVLITGIIGCSIIEYLKRNEKVETKPVDT